MKNTIKKISAFLLSLVLLLGIVPLADLDITASAETYSGTCGDNLTWTLDTETGELVISGEGEMYDWTSPSSAPWDDNRSYIKTVTIADGVTSIGDVAFVYCTSLTNIDIPDSVKSIGSYAFYASGLATITIGNSVISIGNSAFSDCDRLTNIDIPDSVTSIGENAFSSCDKLASVTIGNSVTSISNSAFENCGSLTSIGIPDSVTSIGENAFSNCDKLANVTIGNGVKSIGSCAFYDCRISNIVIPDSVTSIGTSAFYLSSLSTVTIGNGVTIIGSNAFSNCYLKSIDIPDSVTSIGNSAFSHCTVLTSATIGNGVTSIGKSTFSQCYKLTSVTIGNSVTSIGNYAFEYCSSLNSVAIDNGVTSIGYATFKGCDNLTDVYYNGTEEQWNKITIGSYNDPLRNATIHFLGEDVHECDYTAVVTPPTCQTQGYTTYTCEECGDSYVDDYTDTVDHYYLDGKCIWCGDTNVTPSSIIDITYTPSDSARKLFTVTCADRAQMIQFIEPDGGTRTYYRNNANVKITSYNADGEVVGELSRDLAYEVWEIYSNMSIGTTIKVRAKFNSRWELDKRSLVVYEYNPIISMELSRTSGKKGPVPATVVADEKTENVKFKMPNGTSVTVTQFTTDENGNRVFKGNAWANEDGLNVITVTIRRKNVTKTVGTLEYTVE